MADNNNPPRRQPSRRAKKEGEEEEQQQQQQQQQGTKKRTTTGTGTSGTKSTAAAATGSSSRSSTSTSSTTRTTSRVTSTTTRRTVSNASSDTGAESSSSSTTTRTGRSASGRSAATGATSTTGTTSRISRTASGASSTSSASGAKKEPSTPARRSTARTTTTAATRTGANASKETAAAKQRAARTTTTSSSSSSKPATKETVEYEMTVDSEEVPAKKKATKKSESSTPNGANDEDAAMAVDTQEPVVDPVEEALALVVSDITQNFYLLQKAVATIEARFTTRVIRTLVSIRRRMDAEALRRAIKAYSATGNETTETLLSYLSVTGDEAMEVDKPSSSGASASEAIAPLPEIEMYLSLLVLTWLIDQKQLDKATELSQRLVTQIGQLNRRTLDQIAARIYFYYARVFELTERSTEIRAQLLAAHHTASLRRDDELQATLINLLLRNYFQHKLYDQADHLVSKTTFPDSASNSQFARYLYYLGRIKALQLNYTESHQHLTTAIRKAPQTGTAAGFLQSVYKFSVIVQLLMGEIPERSIFRQPILRKALIPYFHLTQAVRIGDLTQFQETLAKHEATFHADSTYTLILRLRHNVIKTGVRMINLAYSRISLRDICLKLHLDSEESAEYIVAKAIRDGVIDAIIDHEHGYVQSKENADIYATTEPQHAFDQRITFCLALHDASVKAMRYPSSDKLGQTDEDADHKEDEDGDVHNNIAALIEDLEEGDDDDMLDDY